MVWTSSNWLNSFCCFPIAFVADVIHPHGPSNKKGLPVIAKEDYGNVKLAVKKIYITVKDILSAINADKTEHFSLKRVCVIQVVKHLNENWLIVLW